MSESGLLREGGVVVMTGPALKTGLECVLIAIKHRKLSGIPSNTYEALACELAAAMAAVGHSDVRLPAISDPVPMEPTVPLDVVRAQLKLGERQARRVAPKLGGKKIGGRWFVDETALHEHIAGRRK
ncbi:hypothetical protein [Mycolicibacterium sp. XJ1904]